MFNVLIFIIGAGIMFYMGLRSVLQRRRLQHTSCWLPSAWAR